MGCDCPHGFKGYHCEIMDKNMLNNVSDEVANPIVQNEGSIIGIVVGVLVLIPIFALLARRAFNVKMRGSATSRTPVNLALEADGGTMPSTYRDNPYKDDANKDTSTSTGTEII